MSEGCLRWAAACQMRKAGFCPMKFGVVLGKEAGVSSSTCDRKQSCSLSLLLGRKAEYLLMETDEAGTLEIMN